jgi:hypothetical protein
MRRLAVQVVPDRDGRQLLGTRPHAGLGGATASVAFAGAAGGRCSCSVYRDRPAACRAFEPGSLKCRVARSQAGLGPDPLAPFLARMKAAEGN